MDAGQQCRQLRKTVLDSNDARSLAEFYRRLLGYEYRPGDEAPTDGAAAPKGQDWLVLRDSDGVTQLAFQQVATLPQVTWPEGPIPQQLHLDMTIGSVDDLEAQHERAVKLGARLLLDRIADPDEPLRVYADPAGHTFCIFVAGDS